MERLKKRLIQLEKRMYALEGKPDVISQIGYEYLRREIKNLERELQRRDLRSL